MNFLSKTLLQGRSSDPYKDPDLFCFREIQPGEYQRSLKLTANEEIVFDRVPLRKSARFSYERGRAGFTLGQRIRARHYYSMVVAPSPREE